MTPGDIPVVLISFVVVFAILWSKGVILWLAVNLWVPLAFVIAVIVMVLLAALNFDRLESDIPHGSRPGSPMGLG